MQGACITLPPPLTAAAGHSACWPSSVDRLQLPISYACTLPARRGAGSAHTGLAGRPLGPYPPARAAMSAPVALASTPRSTSTRPARQQRQQQRWASLAAAAPQQRWQRRWQRGTKKVAVAMVAQQQPPAAAAAAVAAVLPPAEADLSSALSLANIRQASMEWWAR